MSTDKNSQKADATTAEVRAKKEDERSEDQAKAQLESIQEMVATLRAAYTGDGKEYDAVDNARQTIQEDALSVQVRSGWYSPGNSHEDVEPQEYEILLCTGGPACRIIGGLNDGEPETATIEHQDWGTPWTEYRLNSEEEQIVLEYALCFYFGG